MDTGQTSSQGEEEGRGQGSSVSFSEEKETKDHAASFSFALSASPIPLIPPTPPTPSCSPPWSGSILTSPLKERKRPGLLHLLPRRKGGGGVRGAPLLCVVVAAVPPVPLIPLLLPLLLPLLPHSPPPPRCVYCCVFPHGLIVVFVSFRPSPRAPSALRPLFRCVVRGTARSLASPSKRLIVISCSVARPRGRK